jgi:glutamate racemase
MSECAPIGVFDSGMGGLTVLRALAETLRGESFLYLGDTARLPYGSKSPETVQRYALQAAEILIERGVRALVVACNTASAFALESLAARHPELPVFGVVEPGAVAAAEAEQGGHVLVLATESTVNGGAYQRAILNLRPDLKVHARACPLLVALAEEGTHDGTFCADVLRHYLHGHMVGDSISHPAAVVLGCTHFPVFTAALTELLPAATRIVDSAATTAAQVKSALATGPAVEGANGAITLLATDGIDRFRRVGRYFLGSSIDRVELVDL